MSPLRRLREGGGESLRALGARAGVDPTYLSRIERGIGDPPLSTLARIFSALGSKEIADRLNEDAALIAEVLTPTEEVQ